MHPQILISFADFSAWIAVSGVPHNRNENSYKIGDGGWWKVLELIYSLFIVIIKHDM